MIPTIDQLLVKSDQNLTEVLKVIDSNAQGVCFVVDENGKMIGVLTDGDIRRAFINKADLTTIAAEVMNPSFISFPMGTGKEDLIQHLSSKIRHIPLLDNNGLPVDYASLHRYNRFPVSEPLLTGNELEYVSNCIKTNWISSAGKYVRNFEKMLAEYCQMPYALAVSNGTVALHLALDALGIGPGDEVIVPDLTFAASINSIIYTGATPVLVDIERDSWNIDPAATEAAITDKTKAIMPVHLYGLPANMDAISAIAKKHNLLVVEDAAEAIGSFYKGKPAGSMSDASTFSFYGNKTITTGEGGMILFKDKAVYEKAMVLRDHGMSKDKRYWHEHVGYNYRLTNVQAAIGCAQMERVDAIVNRKIEMANAYIQQLSSVAGITLQASYPDITSTYWLFTVLLDTNNELSRDALIEKLQMNGIETRPVFYPLHEMPPYQKYVRNQTFENATYVSSHGICLPSYLELKNEEIQLICEVLKQQVARTALAK